MSDGGRPVAVGRGGVGGGTGGGGWNQLQRWLIGGNMVGTMRKPRLGKGQRHHAVNRVKLLCNYH